MQNSCIRVSLTKYFEYIFFRLDYVGFERFNFGRTYAKPRFPPKRSSAPRFWHRLYPVRVVANRTDFSGGRENAAKEFPTIDYVVTEIDRLLRSDYR